MSGIRTGPSLARTTFTLSRGHLALAYLPAAAIIAVCAIRYYQQPSFWFDEAWVALSLRNPQIGNLFGRIGRGLYFPRPYLVLIAILRDLFGYRIWALRLLPFLAFTVGTMLWAGLLARRAGRSLILAGLGGALLFGADYWLGESIQVKQYTLDVALALIPFVVGDSVYDEALCGGERRWAGFLLALPCFFSYVYPAALGARLLGWYAVRRKKSIKLLDRGGVLLVTLPALAALVFVWAIDLKNGANLTGYWQDCILGFRIRQGPWSALRLLADYIWGWQYGKFNPLFIAILGPLQAAGAWSAISLIARPDRTPPGNSWGSRTVGSLIFLFVIALASLAINYPICAGRLVLPAEIHTQILALEGGAVLLTWLRRRVLVQMFVLAALASVSIYSVHRFVQFTRSAPPEDIRDILPLMKPQVADTVWVEHCSVVQVKALPMALPVSQVIYGSKKGLPPPGSKVWVLWSHMDEDCSSDLSRVQSGALKWRQVYQGHDLGLALAEF